MHANPLAGLRLPRRAQVLTDEGGHTNVTIDDVTELLTDGDRVGRSLAAPSAVAVTVRRNAVRQQQH
jgi:uncharacterized protein (DUF302 family)